MRFHAPEPLACTDLAGHEHEHVTGWLAEVDVGHGADGGFDVVAARLGQIHDVYGEHANTSDTHNCGGEFGGVEVLVECFGIDCRRGNDDAHVGPAAAHFLEKPQKNFRGNSSFVCFINHNHAVSER